MAARIYDYQQEVRSRRRSSTPSYSYSSKTRRSFSTFCSRLVRNSIASGGLISCKYAAQDGNAAVFFRVQQHFFAARAAFGDIDRRPDPLIDQRPVEHDFQIAGPFELLKNHIVHPAAGFDQRRGQNRQRTPFFDFAGRAEELLGLLQCIGVDAAG